MGGISYDLDFATSGLKWSDELYADFGYEQTTPSNSIEWWTGHIHPDDAMILNEAMDKLTDPEVGDWTVQYRFRKADNSYVLVEDHAVIFRDGVGKAIRLAGSLTPLPPAPKQT